LSLDEQSFIGTGDLRSSQDIYESVILIQSHMESLRQVAKKHRGLRDPITRLDRAVDWVLASLRRASEVQQSEGPAAAVALLDKDESIAEATRQALRLRQLATDGAFQRVQTERKMKSILDILL